MANKYWVSTGNAFWSSAANWRTSSGGTTSTAVPNATDNVFFDANSGTGTVTIGAAAVCLDLNCTNWGGTIAGTSSLGISGSFFGGGSWTYTGTATFNSTSTGNTIDCIGTGSGTGNGIGLGRSNIVFNGVGGEWSTVTGIQANTAAITTRTITLTAGTLTVPTSSYYIECGSFSSSGTGVRSISAPNGIAFFIYGTTGTVLNMATVTNLTFPYYFDFFIGNYSGALNTNTKTVSLGAFSAANAPNIVHESTGGTLSITGSVNTLYLSQGPGGLGTVANNALTIYGGVDVTASGLTFAGGANAWTFAGTGTGPLSFNGSTIDFPIVVNGGGRYEIATSFTQGATRSFTFSAGTLALYNTITVGSFVTSGTTLKYLNSGSVGVQQTISQASGTVTATYLSVQDSNATGGATWDGSSATNINAGNNTGWTLPPIASSGSANFFMLF